MNDGAPAPAGRLRREAEQYLMMRRALGFKLSTQGRLLLSFVDFCEQQGVATVTTDAAVAWATATPRSRDSLWWARRLMVVRIFARHLHALDPATQVPPDDVLPHSFRRTTPYLYSEEQLRALMQAAHLLQPRLRAATYATVIGLLAACGLRISEACRLDHEDVDLDTGVLTVRDSKFGKSRIVPVHATTLGALRIYAVRRDHLCPATASTAFFVSTRGTRLDAHNTSHTFAELLEAAGIRPPAGVRRPRLHDLRHTFTVATLLEWYRAGVEVQARLPVLST
ncbi:MAG TPA: tyrosine-type recombinase/integrase, partial [Pseudonocardiaceae bacterium]|nr:tyrosine-type recombinase/integrase [Pseudonocardiaceae bacterium]